MAESHKKTKALKKEDSKEMIEKRKAAYQLVFKKFATKNYQLAIDPQLLSKKGGEMFKQYRQMNDGPEKDEFEEKLNEKMIEYSKAMSLDTKIHALNGIDLKLGGMALEMMRQLEAEYEISSPQDKGYVQIAVSAFCRYHSIMNEFQCWKSPQYLSHEVASLLGTLSKEADRAFRQYNTVIQYFEAKKNPPIVLNVKTNTAFIAQNQQNVANNQDKDENNASK